MAMRDSSPGIKVIEELGVWIPKLTLSGSDLRFNDAVDCMDTYPLPVVGAKAV